MRVVVSYTDVHGTGESLASAAAGPVTNVNDAPVLGTAALASDPGQAVTLGAANLSATDVDDPAATLVFTVSNVTNGQFELVGAPGAAIASFTQAQINGGQIRFVHDGSNSAPAFSVSISDGSTTVGPYVASGSLTVSALAPAPAPAAALPPLALAAVIAPAGTAIAPRVSGLLQATPLPPSGSEAPAPAEVTLLPSLREPVADEAEVATARAQPLPGRPAALSNALWQGQGTESPRAQPVTLTAGPVVAAAERAPVFWQSAFERDPLKFQPPLSVDWSTAAPFQTNGTGQEQAVEGVEEMQVLVELSRLGGVALSIGTIAWALRATALASRLLVSIPAWRHLDPIPVLAGDDDERSRDFPSDSETVADELGIELMLDSAADRAVRA
jgi:hypothetical protein